MFSDANNDPSRDCPVLGTVDSLASWLSTCDRLSTIESLTEDSESLADRVPLTDSTNTPLGVWLAGWDTTPLSVSDPDPDPAPAADADCAVKSSASAWRTRVANPESEAAVSEVLADPDSLADVEPDVLSETEVFADAD